MKQKYITGWWSKCRDTFRRRVERQIVDGMYIGDVHWPERLFGGTKNMSSIPHDLSVGSQSISTQDVDILLNHSEPRAEWDIVRMGSDAVASYQSMNPSVWFPLPPLSEMFSPEVDYLAIVLLSLDHILPAVFALTRDVDFILRSRDSRYGEEVSLLSQT